MYISTLQVKLTVLHSHCAVCGRNICITVPGDCDMSLRASLSAGIHRCQAHEPGKLSLWFDEAEMIEAFEISPEEFWGLSDVHSTAEYWRKVRTSDEDE